MIKRTYYLYQFLQAVQGNWRKAIFIGCISCPFGDKEACRGYLLAADADSKLLVMMVEEFEELTGQRVAREECLEYMDRKIFEEAYFLYLKWETISDRVCSLGQLYKKNLIP